MSELRTLVDKLGPPPFAEQFVDQSKDWIDSIAQDGSVSTRFVAIQALLHLPRFSEHNIIEDPDTVRNQLEPVITGRSQRFRLAYDGLVTTSRTTTLTSAARLEKDGPDLVVQQAGSETNQVVVFDNVPPDTAETIQTDVHYLGCPRNDRLADFGLRLHDATAPFAYVSFSGCNKDYLVKALQQTTGLALRSSEIIVMTRGYALDTAPANSMSKLLQLAGATIREQAPQYRVLVTALNPYLGFKGSTYLAANYRPFATVPISYHYDEAGRYIRHTANAQKQAAATPPNLRFTQGLDKTAAVVIRQLSVSSIINVTEHDYDSSR